MSKKKHFSVGDRCCHSDLKSICGDMCDRLDDLSEIALSQQWFLDTFAVENKLC